MAFDFSKEKFEIFTLPPPPLCSSPKGLCPGLQPPKGRRRPAKQGPLDGANMRRGVEVVENEGHETWAKTWSGTYGDGVSGGMGNETGQVGRVKHRGDG
ncbi:hypothetical protein ERO13_A04G037400v2 [Gossypium hirsutum]|nr:hypothetical protein ERO13_A04G037400v2 [Gossypium hirsutum]